MTKPKHWNQMLSAWAQVQESNVHLEVKVERLSTLVSLQFNALSRIIAKLDPTYGKTLDEISNRKPEDIILEQNIINNLIGDFEAQQHRYLTKEERDYLSRTRS
jgi:hypothetical protein